MSERIKQTAKVNAEMIQRMDNYGVDPVQCMHTLHIQTLQQEKAFLRKLDIPEERVYDPGGGSG